MNTQTQNKEIVQYALDRLDNGYEGTYACDLHNELFNTDYFIIGTYEAKKWLESNPGVFEAINEIKEYERFNFGQVTTDLSDPEKVVNMHVYIKGEEILSSINRLSDVWDDRLTSEDIEAIRNELTELL